MPADLLSDVKIRAAKPRKAAYKLTDGLGLYVLVAPSGSRLWRLKFRLAGVERTYAIGAYPEVSLREARVERDRVRALVRAGLDPVAERRDRREAQAAEVLTFRRLFDDWHSRYTHTGRGPLTDRHRDDIYRAVEANLLPALGAKAAAEIRPKDALEALRVIEDRGAIEMAKRCRMWAGMAYRMAVAGGLVPFNPFDQLRGALRTRPARHFSAVRAEELPALLRALDAYDGEPTTQLGLRFLLLTMTRTQEVRFARWEEIGGDLWSIPASRMKMRRDHLVPLSPDALAILEQLRPLTERHGWLFPQSRKPQLPMSENTMLYALYRMGWHRRATVHGFRALASTVLNESGFDKDVIERQLAHVEENATRAAYNRAEYLEQRRSMLNWWAGYLNRAAALPATTESRTAASQTPERSA